MLLKLFLLFAILPIVEIALLIHVGEWFGGWNTVAIVIITAFVGAHLVRQQGFQTFMQARNKMASGQPPEQEMAEGLLLLVAGVLLVTPGFITDGIGLLFTLPVTRPAIARELLKNFSSRIVVGSTGFNQQGFHQSQQHSFHQSTQRQSRFNDNHTIEGEYEKKDN